jgi:hypothetical protein
MTLQNLNQNEIDTIVEAMESADFGREIEIELEEDCWQEVGDDGQPDEYTEWQDYMGGDDWDQGQYETEDYFDGGIDF